MTSLPSLVVASAIISMSCMAETPKLDPAKITIPVDTTFSLSLPNNPTTGYTWTITSSDPKVVQFTTKEQKPDPNLVGAPSPLTVSIQALKKGTSTITLIYHRAWEKDKEPLIKMVLPITGI